MYLGIVGHGLSRSLLRQEIRRYRFEAGGSAFPAESMRIIITYLLYSHNLERAGMSAPPDSRATVILDTRGVLVKGKAYHAVLTRECILLTGDTDGVPRKIAMRDVLRTEQDVDHYGDPVLTLCMPVAGGSIHTIIMHFPKERFPNALRLRDLWASEITRLTQQSVPGASLPGRQVSPAPAFCSRCGNRLAGGAAFCNHCGARVPGSPRNVPVSWDYSRGQVDDPDIASGTIELSPRDVSLSSAARSRHQEKASGATMLSKGRGNEDPVLAGSVVKLVGIGCIVITTILIIAVVLMMGAPAGSPNRGSDSPGMNLPLPDFSTVQSSFIPAGVVGQGPYNPGSSAEQETISVAENEAARAAAAYGPGEPGALLSGYPLHFNAGDGAGLRDLLSEKMQSDYPAYVLNQELAQARSGGYTMENIRVQDQVIEGDIAVVIADISWNIGGSVVITSPRIYFIREDNQWKLDSLIMQP